MSSHVNASRMVVSRNQPFRSGLLLTTQDHVTLRDPPKVTSGCWGAGFRKSIRQGTASPPDEQGNLKAVWTTWQHHSVDPWFPFTATAANHCRWSQIRRLRCAVRSSAGHSNGTAFIPTVHKALSPCRPSWNKRSFICERLLSVSSHQDTRRPASVRERSRCDVQMGPVLGNEI